MGIVKKFFLLITFLWIRNFYSTEHIQLFNVPSLYNQCKDEFTKWLHDASFEEVVNSELAEYYNDSNIHEFVNQVYTSKFYEAFGIVNEFLIEHPNNSTFYSALDSSYEFVISIERVLEPLDFFNDSVKIINLSTGEIFTIKNPRIDGQGEYCTIPYRKGKEGKILYKYISKKENNLGTNYNINFAAYNCLHITKKTTETLTYSELIKPLKLCGYNGISRITISSDDKYIIMDCNKKYTKIIFTDNSLVRSLNVYQLKLISWLYRKGFSDELIKLNEIQMAIFNSLPILIQRCLKSHYDIQH